MEVITMHSARFTSAPTENLPPRYFELKKKILLKGAKRMGVLLLWLIALVVAVAAEAQTVLNVDCVPNQNCAPRIQGAINAAPPEGAVINLEEGEHLISSAVIINKPNIHLRGQGRTKTVFTHSVNIGSGGSAGIFWVRRDSTAVLMTGVTISDFTIRADRDLNPTMRTPAIRVASSVENLTIRDMNLEGITSTCILLSGWHIHGVSIVNNFCNEYYEQFVELAIQHSSQILIGDNVSKSTKGHPSLGSTEPFPIAITPGHSGNGSGLVDRVWIVGNTFDHRNMVRTEMVNSLGVMLSEDQASKGYQFGFQNIHVIGNKFFGLGRAVRVQLFRTSAMPAEPHGFVTVENNEIRNMVFEPFEVSGPATAKDVVIYGRNFIDFDNCGACQPYKLNTLATVMKLRNRCLKAGVTYDCN
jgi:hypothetical protein